MGLQKTELAVELLAMSYLDAGLARATQVEMGAFAQYCREIGEPFPIELHDENSLATSAVYGFGEQRLGRSPAAPFRVPVDGYYLQKVSEASYSQESLSDFIPANVDISNLAEYNAFQAVTTLKYVSPTRIAPGYYWTTKDVHETKLFGVIDGAVEPDALLTMPEAPSKFLHQAPPMRHAFRWLIDAGVRRESREFRTLTGELDKKNILDIFNHLGWAAASLVDLEIL